jgi:hypothetical protein
MPQGDESDEESDNLGERVVIGLVNKLKKNDKLKPYHQMYFDNYFTSIRLLQRLAKKNIYGCGTIRSNRKGMPKSCTKPCTKKCPKNCKKHCPKTCSKHLPRDNQMERGQIVTKHKRGVYVTKWRDNRSVFMASNFHFNEEIIVKRKMKNGKKIDVECPKVIGEYNKYMGGVDYSDRMIETYARDRWSKRKPWHRLFFHFLDLCIVNSYILYKIHHGEESCTLKMFKKRLADELCREQRADYAQSKRQSREVNTNDTFPMRYVNCYHEPAIGERRHCWLCWNTNKVKINTTISCATCEIGLCLKKDKDCWNKFHKK